MQVVAMVGKHELKLTFPVSIAPDEMQSRIATAIKVYKEVMDYVPSRELQDAGSTSLEESEEEGEDIETTDDEVESSDSPLPEDVEFLKPHPDDVTADELERLADELSEGSAESASSAEGDAADSDDGAEVDADKPDEDPDFDVEEETAAEKAEREAEAAREAARRKAERERPAKTRAAPGVSIGAKLLNVKTGKKPSRLRKTGPKAAAKAEFLHKDTDAAAPPTVDLVAEPARVPDPVEPPAPAQPQTSSSVSVALVDADPGASAGLDGLRTVEGPTPAVAGEAGIRGALADSPAAGAGKLDGSAT